MLHSEIALPSHCTSLDFQTWKDEFENTTKSQFVRGTGEKKGGEATIIYYYCNRSGHVISRGANTRHAKVSGSCKIGAHCTAAIVLTKEVCSSSILVNVYKTHYGHQCSLGQIRLPTTHRDAIAGKLAQGVAVQHIIDEIRDNVGDRFERIHLITRKDITNIERSYGLQGSRRHNDDATSVQLWVEEVNRMGKNNPVLMYKPQGKLTEKPNLLEKEVEVAKKCGPNKVIYIDATHGTTG